jgi:hypothetical protein
MGGAPRCEAARAEVGGEAHLDNLREVGGRAVVEGIRQLPGLLHQGIIRFPARHEVFSPLNHQRRCSIRG